MKGQVDTSFETLQRDIFASGMAATIGHVYCLGTGMMLEPSEIPLPISGLCE